MRSAKIYLFFEVLLAVVQNFIADEAWYVPMFIYVYVGLFLHQMSPANFVRLVIAKVFLSYMCALIHCMHKTVYIIMPLYNIISTLTVYVLYDQWLIGERACNSFNGEIISVTIYSNTNNYFEILGKLKVQVLVLLFLVTL